MANVNLVILKFLTSPLVNTSGKLIKIATDAVINLQFLGVRLQRAHRADNAHVEKQR